MGNTVYEDAHIIDANTSCSELELTGVVFRNNKCNETHCVSLGYRNTLTNVHLQSNNGSSSDTSQDSSVFFASEGSENVVVDMSSKQNAIRSIQVFNGTMNIINSQFEDNHATFGAAVRFNPTSSGYVDNCTFVRNSALNEGGAVHVAASTVNLSSSFFRGNNASHGGSIYFVDRCNSSIVDSTFENNTAGGRGGAIYSYYNSLLVLSDSSFEGDK